MRAQQSSEFTQLPPDEPVNVRRKCERLSAKATSVAPVAAGVVELAIGGSPAGKRDQARGRSVGRPAANLPRVHRHEQRIVAQILAHRNLRTKPARNANPWSLCVSERYGPADWLAVFECVEREPTD